MLGHRLVQSVGMDLVGFAGGVATCVLRFVGAFFSPAARLADRLEGALIQAHLHEPQLKASRLELSLWPQSLLGDSQDYIKWLVKITPCPDAYDLSNLART